MNLIVQEWLWCETWCGNETKHAAKTIDLCNNPLTKEPKLQSARRIAPEWIALDAEAQAFTAKVSFLVTVIFHTALVRWEYSWTEPTYSSVLCHTDNPIRAPSDALEWLWILTLYHISPVALFVSIYTCNVLEFLCIVWNRCRPVLADTLTLHTKNVDDWDPLVCADWRRAWERGRAIRGKAWEDWFVAIF